jgi:integrase/recombinase XerD
MMLIDHFPKSHLRYQESPASSWLADFADWLERSGYAHSATHRHVRRLWHILEACGQVAPDAIFSAPELAAMFTSPCRQSEFRSTQRAFESFLIDSGHFRTEPDRRRFSRLLDSYRIYLIEVRGLAPATVGQHIKTADAFLTQAVPDGDSLQPLSATAIERFVTAAGQRVKRQSLQHTVARLRAFLRFCYSGGELSERLDCIDTPRA